MQISAAGSKPAQRQGGFTLLELLVVVTIIAFATAGVALSMRDSAQTRLEQDAQRLAALLESARAQSRKSGVPVRWVATPQAFEFQGLAPGALPQKWLDDATTAPQGASLDLGPEPILAGQSVTLRSTSGSAGGWRAGTDGLHPFAVEPL